MNCQIEGKSVVKAEKNLSSIECDFTHTHARARILLYVCICLCLISVSVKYTYYIRSTGGRGGMGRRNVSLQSSKEQNLP